MLEKITLNVNVLDKKQAMKTIRGGEAKDGRTYFILKNHIAEGKDGKDYFYV